MVAQLKLGDKVFQGGFYGDELLAEIEQQIGDADGGLLELCRIDKAEAAKTGTPDGDDSRYNWDLSIVFSDMATGQAWQVTKYNGGILGAKLDGFTAENLIRLESRTDEEASREMAEVVDLRKRREAKVRSRIVAEIEAIQYLAERAKRNVDDAEVNKWEASNALGEVEDRLKAIVEALEKPGLSFDERLAAASARVAELDQIDGRKDRDLGTIIAALSAGLREPNTDAAYDALVMLMDVREIVGGGHVVRESAGCRPG